MIQRVKNQLKIRTEDVSFVIDELKIMFEEDRRFSKVADFDNIGIFGHSFGGCTSIMSSLLKYIHQNYVRKFLCYQNQQLLKNVYLLQT